MTTYKKLYESLLASYSSLLEEYEQYKKESIKWSIEDFTELEVYGWQITREQAQEALEDMIYHHDACNGVSWDDVEYYLKEHGEEVEKGRELWRETNKVNN